MQDCPLYINGQPHQPSEDNWQDVVNPADGSVIGRVALAGRRDIDAAVTVAKAAQFQWANTHPDERAAILLAGADRIEWRSDAIARMLTLEQGKPLCDSLKEIAFGLKVLRYYAEEGRKVYGSIRPTSSAEIRSVVTYKPVGVVGAIVPWNYPVDLYCWKVGAALAAGCPIIVKPPPETPFAIQMVAECLVEAGLPAGALANCPGTGPETGVALSEHSGIDCISATASVAAGQDIMRRSAGNLKRLVLELGGHAPFLVLPDADVNEAAAAAVRRSFSNMGQICITVNRILTHESIHDDFVSALVSLTEAIELSPGLSPGSTYGPVTLPSVMSRAANHIEDARAKGGKIIVGGGKAAGEEFADGYFFEPTLIDDAPLDSLPMIEETYGPVAAIHRCRSLEEILQISNSLDFGLAAYIYSKDLEVAWDLADHLEFGAVGINVSDTSELQAPFGGWKLSGVGAELGPEGLSNFLLPKHTKMRVKSALRG